MRSFILLFTFVFVCLCYGLIYFPWKKNQYNLRILQEAEADEFVNMGEYYEIHHHWVLQETPKPEPDPEFKIINYDHRHLYGLFL